MKPRSSEDACNHPRLARREALQIGSIGLLGMGLNHLTGLRQAVAADSSVLPGKAKSCIFIFLSGGLAQHESFDMKPNAPDTIRGEFKPISTRNTRAPDLRTSAHVGPTQ